MMKKKIELLFSFFTGLCMRDTWSGRLHSCMQNLSSNICMSSCEKISNFYSFDRLPYLIATDGLVVCGLSKDGNFCVNAWTLKVNFKQIFWLLKWFIFNEILWRLTKMSVELFTIASTNIYNSLKLQRFFFFCELFFPYSKQIIENCSHAFLYF